MGKEKAGFLTPKAISNRIKAKGLQKLRWFCQMCQKQCRDENGFKCHLTSESHQRQLLLFAENPDKYLDSFSKEFFDDFIELVSRRFGTKRVHANVVYQEYISFRQHTHMNSTQWETLTEFVKWLGREGYCTVDETEKGWFLQYIDRNPEVIRRQTELAKKEKMDLDDEERAARFIQKQIERATAGSAPEQQGGEKADAQFTELKRDSESEKVVFNLGMSGSGKKAGLLPASIPASPLLVPQSSGTRDGRLADDSNADTASVFSLSSHASTSSGSSKDGGRASHKTLSSITSGAAQKRKSALDEIMQAEEENKEKMNRKDYWLCKDVVVKVVTKTLGEKYYKKKGIIIEVKEKYAASVKMLDSDDKLKLDQAHLETVIPAIGKAVMVVNGAYRGMEAVLTGINEASFCCSITLKSGLLKGRVVNNVQYEDICKLYSDT